ncbi:MAG: hypothetical protein QW767_02200 [Thermoprotei archaeon]
MRKFKLECVDESGVRITLTVEGGVRSEQIEQITALLTKLTSSGTGSRQVEADVSTVFGRVASLMEDFSSEEWVPSSLVKDAYTKRYGADVPLPLVSTYLSRLSRMGVLERAGARNRRVYRLVKKSQAGL